MIEDISTRRYPQGIQLKGKWDFIAVDDIGEDILKESNHFRILKQKGKIEVVDGNYVKRNEHKIKMKVSPSEAALDAILVPPDVKAHAAASGDGIRSSRRGSMLNDDAIEIMVD